MIGKRKAMSGIVSAYLLLAAAAPATAQRTAGSGGEAGLMPMIPAEALFFLERRGHKAIRPAMLASNFGKMATDESILQFVHDSRVKIGKMIVTSLFDVDEEDTTQIDRLQKLLHKALKPLWYRPSAMFIMYDPHTDDEPGFGFFCLTGSYRKEAGEALDALMKAALEPEKGNVPVTYRSGLLTWRGAAGGPTGTAMPKDPKALREALGNDSLFLVAWHNQLLCVATNIETVEAISKLLSAPGKSKTAHPGARAVLAKTNITDWSHRWHVDIEGIFSAVEAGGERVSPEMVALGLDKIRGIGGAEGYADGVSTRLTYLDTPGADRGIPRLFARGGSHRRALAMTPPGTVVAMGGQLDPKALMRMVRELVIADSPAATRPALGLEPQTEKILKLLTHVAEGSGGNVTLYVTDLQAMFMGGGESLPFGAVVSLEQGEEARKQALKAVDELIAMAEGDDEDGEDGEDGEGPSSRPAAKASLKMYRRVAIRRVGSRPAVRIAVLKDRLVLAMGDPALKAAIDAALDNMGGVEPDGPGAKLMARAGKGAGFLTLDFPGMARLGWPLLSQLAEEQEDFPFGSLPSTQKMVRLLGPEVAVFEADEGGLLLKSRGTVPFATKAAPIFSMGSGIAWLIFRNF